MRVIIIADYAIAEGGAPQVAIASALGLAARGHDVTYLQGVGQAGDAALDAEPRIRRITLDGWMSGTSPAWPQRGMESGTATMPRSWAPSSPVLILRRAWCMSINDEILLAQRFRHHCPLWLAAGGLAA